MLHHCKTSWRRIVWFVGGACGMLLLVLLVLSFTIFGGHPCASVLEQCDAFRAVCASYNNEHQFFYSQCDMLRENCLTGSAWQDDAIGHCNVKLD